MEEPDIQKKNHAIEQPRKQLWHGALLGLGCGAFTMAASFVCLFMLVVFYAMLNPTGIAGAFKEMTEDEARQILANALFIIAAASFLISLAAGIFSGRAVYRRSSDSDATRRLLVGSGAGLGFGLSFFLIGVCGGIVAEDFLFSLVGMSFGEGTFMFYVVFPAVPGILLSFIGAILGTSLVFRKRLPQR